MTLPIKNLIVILNADSAEPSRLATISSLLSQLDIVSDVYLISANAVGDALRINHVVQQIASFLHDYAFYRITMHPVHPFSSRSALQTLYAGFARTTHPFNQDAYLLQSVARLMILPVLGITGTTDEESLSKFLDFLRTRTMMPSLYLGEGASVSSISRLIHPERERICLELAQGDSRTRMLHTLCRHVSFDDLLAWAADTSVRADVPPCRSFIYFEASGAVTPCLNLLPKEEREEAGFHASYQKETLCCDSEGLLSYHLRTPFLLQKTLALNNRSREWSAVVVQLGLECVKQSRYQEALQQFDLVVNDTPETKAKATLYLYQALCHLRLEDIPRAQAALEAAERFNPSLPLISYYRGHCEFALKDYIEAIDQIQKALDMGAEEVPLGDAYFYMGLAHINIMEYDDGLRMMQKAEPYYRPHRVSPVFYYMGVCHFGTGNIATAYEFFLQALAADPEPEDLSSIYLYLGMCHKEQEEYLHALDMLEKARQAEEDRLDIHNLMGYCYFKLKQHEKAVECFVRAVEIDPGSGIDWANLGVNVRALGDENKALLLFKKAVSLDPSIGFAWKHLQELMHKGNE